MSSRQPSSPRLSSSHSRNSSVASQSANQHAPMTPSGLREAHTIVGSPEDTQDAPGIKVDAAPSSSETSPNTFPAHLDTDPGADDDALDGRTHGFGDFGSRAVTETTALLKKPFEFVLGTPHAGPCNHGTFSPRLEPRADSVKSGRSGFGGLPPLSGRPDSPEGRPNMFGSFLDTVGVRNGSGGKKKMSTTNYLAEQHGITNTTTMYVTILHTIPSSYIFC
jgi:hypothetical protein